MSWKCDRARGLSTRCPRITRIYNVRHARWHSVAQLVVGVLKGIVDKAALGNQRSQVHNTQHTIPLGKNLAPKSVHYNAGRDCFHLTPMLPFITPSKCKQLLWTHAHLYDPSIRYPGTPLHQLGLPKYCNIQ